jgi:hypothetical protein
MAKPLFHSAKRAINFLAQSAAKKAVTEQLRDQGIRVSHVPIAEIMSQASAYLSDHPELYQEALEQARRMGWVDLQPPMVTPDLGAERNS